MYSGYPPPSAYPPQGQYGAPPPQGQYPPQGGYPPAQGGYGAYNAPQYGAPPPQGYGAPPQAYGQPPQAYGQSPQPYGQPQPGYGGPPMAYGGAPAQPADPVRAWFDAVDANRNGKIDTRELQSALSRAGHEFSHGVAERILRMHDRDNTGTLSFMEFKQAYQFIKTMTDGFRARDRDNSGILEGPEVRAALAASGYQLQEGTFQTMMKKFDKEQCGGLRLDDYIALSISIGTIRNVFAFYDRARTGQVTFNFDTFFTAVLTCS